MRGREDGPHGTNPTRRRYASPAPASEPQIRTTPPFPADLLASMKPSSKPAADRKGTAPLHARSRAPMSAALS
jgi:hypothetical protein